MVFGRIGWPEGNDMVAEREANASLVRRSRFHDDLHLVAANCAEPAADGSEGRTTYEAFYQLCVSDYPVLPANV